jgi:hypothetical protein
MSRSPPHRKLSARLPRERIERCRPALIVICHAHSSRNGQFVILRKTVGPVHAKTGRNAPAKIPGLLLHKATTPLSFCLSVIAMRRRR